MAGSNINKLVLNGVTEFDISGDTVAPETLLRGVTAHDRSGASITGIADNDLTSAATGDALAITDAADGYVQEITVKGHSEVVSGEIVSVGDDGLTITSTDGTASTTAAITTGLPLRSASESVYDEISGGNVITRCEIVNDEVAAKATPVVTPLTPTEKAALAALRTYSGTTSISATDSPVMTVRYLKDTDNGKAVANVENRCSLKYVTWRGTGSSSNNNITFPERPTLVLSIQFTNKPSNSAAVMPFRYGAPSVFCSWSSNPGTHSGSYNSSLSYSADGLTMTINGSDKGSAWNDETTDYILYYF